MRPWSTARGWTPRRYRIDAAVWRWVICPLISLTILACGAFFATFARAEEWCADSSICFDIDRIVYSTSTPGQMLVLAQDHRANEGGWIAVDCVAHLAAGAGPILRIRPGSALAKLCDTIGSDE